ncbi:MAG TPA: hypothetical protein VIU29_03610 [Candidatus Deferrimicrobiaceae bacterium]
MPLSVPRSLFGLSVSLCLISACAHGTGGDRRPDPQAPSIAHSTAGAGGVSSPSGLDFAVTWERALNNLYFKGYPVKSADRKSGTIVTEKKVMLLDASAADCPEFRVFPHISDKRAIKYVSQTIVIGEGERATIQVVSTIDGVPDDRPSESGKRLMCMSRGVLERELVAEIIAPQRSSQTQ